MMMLDEDDTGLGGPQHLLMYVRACVCHHSYPHYVIIRYVFDPLDVAAEMEVTARVRKAAAEALMAAEGKLRAAEEAHAALKQQLEESKELSKVGGWVGAGEGEWAVGWVLGAVGSAVL
jgi:hypothetical protein